MEFIASLRRSGKIVYLAINFVVQKKNLGQMPAFVELGKFWGVDRVVFMKLGPPPHTEKPSNFDFVDSDVIDVGHPDHGAFLDVLDNPIMKAKEIDLYNILPTGTDRDYGSDRASNAEARSS